MMVLCKFQKNVNVSTLTQGGGTLELIGERGDKTVLTSSNYTITGGTYKIDAYASGNHTTLNYSGGNFDISGNLTSESPIT